MPMSLEMSLGLIHQQVLDELHAIYVAGLGNAHSAYLFAAGIDDMQSVSNESSVASRYRAEFNRLTNRPV